MIATLFLAALAFNIAAHDGKFPNHNINPDVVADYSKLNR